MILLDTHVWLRLAAEPNRLSRAATSAIRRAERDRGIAISTITLWEACWLRRRGKLRASRPMRDWIGAMRRETGVEVTSPTPEVCLLAAELPDALPADPCDRLIVATALTLGCPLVTADERIRASRAVETIW